MNFNRGRERESVEINLIPFIDVLLVIIIFLMMTTTYSKYSGLEINLPSSNGAPSTQQAEDIVVGVTLAGDVTINNAPVDAHDPETLTLALRRLVPSDGRKAPVVIINADAKANFQSVVNVMKASQDAGLPAVSFSTQSGK